jgi:Family of unknown function (DUF5825)
MRGLPGQRLISVAKPVELSARDAYATSSFVAWLRDTLADWALVDWHGDVSGVDTTLLWHLPPPSEPLDLPGDPPATKPAEPPAAAVTRWREAFRPGLCYYRNGPGFIQVKDVRDLRRSVRMTLDHPAHLEAFRTCLRPARVSALFLPVQFAVEQLAAERLILLIGGYATSLPVRMRRWPIPCSA